MQGVTVGYGRNGDTLRVYGGCDDSLAYEFTWAGQAWIKASIGKGRGQVHGLSVTPARNDDTNRIYAGIWTTGGIVETVYRNGTWTMGEIGSGYSNSYDGFGAYGRNDDTLRVYTGTNSGQCYELTRRNGTWASVLLGGSSSSADGSMHDVFVGNGRNDDTVRVYGACTDGNVWEFSYRNGTWFPLVIGTTDGCAWGVCVAEGRNDGVDRVYASCGPQGNPGDLFEFTWDGAKWNRTLVGHTTSCLFGLGAGYGRNDDTLRIYTGTFSPGHLYEYTWREDAWQFFDCGTVPSGSWLHDIYPERGRNDDTIRVYAAGGDSWVHEFTYRPDAGVRCYPDSSIMTNPGVPVIYPLWVVNTGSHIDTLDITTSNTMTGWTARLLDAQGQPLIDSDGDDKVDVGAVESTDSIRIELEITSPSSASAGAMDSTRVWAASSLAPLVRDSALLVTIVAQVSGLAVEPDQAKTSLAGDTVDYELTVRNESNSSDLVDLSLSGPLSGWNAALLDEAFAPLIDSDGDGNVDIGPLAPGESMEVIARIISSTDAEGGTIDTTRVIGELNVAPSVRDAATLITTIRTVPEVSIVRDSTDSTHAGVAIRYRALVTNLGNTRDTINLGFSSLKNWPGTLYDSTGTRELGDSDADSRPDVGQMPAYGSQTLLWLDILPPVNTRHNTIDTSYLVASSSIDESVRDSIRLITRVLNLEPGVSVEPDAEGTVDAGKQIVYTLRVVNEGNEPDSFDLWMESDLSWLAQLRNVQGQEINRTGVLDARETLSVEVVVNAPAELASIVGDPTELNTEHRSLWARSISNTSIADSCYILTLAVPPLDIHNFPNPFRGATTFIYSIPSIGLATLAVYNRAGEHIVTLFEDISHDPGIFTVNWDGLSEKGLQAAPGVYLYTLTFRPDEGKTRSIVKKALVQP